MNLRILATLTLSTFLGPAGLLAQGPMQFKVPFDFTVGKKSFAAGVYTVRTAVAPSAVAISSADGRASLITLTNGVQSRKPAGQGKLVFNRYGERYFLAQVWTPGGDTGRQFHQSSEERELIAQTAPLNPVALSASAQE